MKKAIKSMYKIIRLIHEGKSLKDKSVLFLHFLEAPFTKRKKLIADVYIKNKEGIYFCGSNIFSAWCACSFVEEGVKRYMKIDKGAFVDVGANIGKYSILIGKRYPNNDVISIEPEQGNIEILEKNINLNKLKNITVIPKACFSKKAKITLYKDGLGTGGHSIYKKTNQHIIIEAEALDSILKNAKIKKVDLIKIDVEGAEYDVLKGAGRTLNQYHPKIIAECWDEKKLAKVLQILNKFNYNMTKISDIDYYFE